MIADTPTPSQTPDGPPREGESARTFVSWDGTELAYASVGRSGAPVVLLSNGLGGTSAAFRHIVKYFDDRLRFVTWDYRGLHKSRLPQDLTRLGVVDHARDADALLRHLDVDRAIVVGWSMGAQVNFELFRLRPELFRALVVINGTAGGAFNAALERRFGADWFPSFAATAGRTAHRWVPLLRWVVSKPRFMSIFKTLGFASESLDEATFQELASDYGSLDFGLYMELIKRLGEHQAEDLLPSIDVPTLIVAGARDLFTPPALSERMHKLIPGSELLLVRGGTHYLPVEFSELLNLRIERFLRDHALLA